MKKEFIIREYDLDGYEIDYYFGDEYLTGAGGYNSNLFIIGLDRYTDFNGDEYKKIQNTAENIIDGFSEVGGKYATYNTFRDCMEDFGIDYNPRKCHLLKEWAKTADERKVEDIADFLTITTGERWTTKAARGYSQGDYADILFCPAYYPNGVEKYGEVWMGCAKAFCVIEIEDGEETESVYGYIVADCEAWKIEDYKRIVADWAGIDATAARLEVIDGYNTTTTPVYRVA